MKLFTLLVVVKKTSLRNIKMRPGSLICKKFVCDYCKMPAVEEQWATSYQNGIIACLNHRDAARRDIRAFYHRRGQVLVEDLLEFSPELTALQRNMTWVDDTGVKSSGGLIRRSAPIACSFVSSFKGQIAIPLDTGVGGVIPLFVKDLIYTDGITKSCVDMLLEKLSGGFYQMDYAAHLVAATTVENTVAMTIPSVVPKAVAAPVTVPVESKEMMLERLTRVERPSRRTKKSRKTKKTKNESEPVSQSNSEGSEGSEGSESSESSDGWTLVK